MKRKEYVYLVTKLFRKAIDAYYNQKDFQLSEEDTKELLLMFIHYSNTRTRVNDSVHINLNIDTLNDAKQREYSISGCYHSFRVKLIGFYR